MDVFLFDPLRVEVLFDSPRYFTSDLVSQFPYFGNSVGATRRLVDLFEFGKVGILMNVSVTQTLERYGFCKKLHYVLSKELVRLLCAGFVPVVGRGIGFALCGGLVL